MDCEKFGKYLDNFESLTENEQLSLTAHASECERCAKELDFMLSVIETIKSLPDIEAPADFMERLNARIDNEERKKRLSSRIAHNVSRNWRQYTAAAACLALVAVLTANGKLLTDRLTGTDDGVIVNDTPVTDGAEPIIPQSVIAEVTEQPTISDNSAVSDTVYETQPQTQTAKAPVRTSERAYVSSADVSSSSKSAVTETESRNTGTDNIETYGIEVASAENSENMIDVQSEEPDMIQGRSRNAIAGYTLSGKPVMETADYVEHGVGRLKIHPKDEKKAMEAVMKYSYETDGDYYTTSPDNMVNIFCDLDDSGVNYANYTPEDYEDLIKFQLVIG